MDRQKWASDEAQWAIRYMAVIGREDFPEERLLRYIHDLVTNIIGHEMPLLIEQQKSKSPVGLGNEVEKIADTYIGSILGEKNLLTKQERELVIERFINALPLNLDRFTDDVWKRILTQLTNEMKVTFSTYQEQQAQGLEPQKKRTKECLTDILNKFST